MQAAEPCGSPTALGHICLQTPVVCKMRRLSDPFALLMASPVPRHQHCHFCTAFSGKRFPYSHLRDPLGAPHCGQGAAALQNTCLCTTWKCSSREGVFWSHPCLRMESVSARFLTMLAHQLVCQTIVACFALLMGPVNSGPCLSCYVATASVLGTDDCHMLQPLKSTLQIVVVCYSDSHTKCSEFCAGLRN